MTGGSEEDVRCMQSIPAVTIADDTMKWPREALAASLHQLVEVGNHHQQEGEQRRLLWLRGSLPGLRPQPRNEPAGCILEGRLAQPSPALPNPAQRCSVLPIPRRWNSRRHRRRRRWQVGAAACGSGCNRSRQRCSGSDCDSRDVSLCELVPPRSPCVPQGCLLGANARLRGNTVSASHFCCATLAGQLRRLCTHTQPHSPLWGVCPCYTIVPRLCEGDHTDLEQILPAR